MAVSVLILVLYCICVNCAVLREREMLRSALYCRDPDTGKLHEVNTNWTSTTFCGNYSCKLRRRNITETHLLRQINITNIHENNIHDNNTEENNTITIEKKTIPDLVSILHKGRDAELINKPSNIIIEPRNNLTQSDAVPPIITTSNYEDRQVTPVYKEIPTEVNKLKINEIFDSNDDDRYLTENEVKTISEVLHTVKKSDLDAIVDIYNLAQDIYNEMDRATNDDLVDATINEIKYEKTNKFRTKSTSYWYEPLADKVKMHDMDVQATHLVPARVQPTLEVPNYFNRAFTNYDFAKLPYYYPISAFQRVSSYVHTPTSPTKRQSQKPCKSKTNQEGPNESGFKNDAKPSYLLPYPFTYINQYNVSDYYPSNLYYNNLWSWDYYNQYRNYQPYYNAYISQIPNAVLINPHLHEDVQDVEQNTVKSNNLLDKLLGKDKSAKMPLWQTEQLPKHVLDDIVANIDTSKKFKAFPLRKQVKLEKVGKLIKVDELARSKRSDEEYKESGEDDGVYETYIEKVTCETQTQPGFFRFGNLSQPYPECCPQLIKNR